MEFSLTDVREMRDSFDTLSPSGPMTVQRSPLVQSGNGRRNG